MIPGRNFFSGACISSQGQARGFQPAAQDAAPLSRIESADILQAIQGTIMTTLGITEPTGRYGYILYYKNPLWEYMGPAIPARRAANRLSLGERNPQDEWPGTHQAPVRYWTYPLSPTQFSAANSARRQGFNPPLRDWAVVEILPAAGDPATQFAHAIGPASQARGANEVGRTNPDDDGRHDQVWVRVLNIDRCVDAPGPTPTAPPEENDPQPTRPGGVGGGWTPPDGKNVSTINTYFECPLQFIVGYWQTPQEAIAARDAEFNRQSTAAHGGGAAGADPAEVARAEADARGDNEPLEPPPTGRDYENPSRYDRELRGGGDNELVCPLINDPNYNICDFYSTEDRSKTMYNLIQTACPDITFNSDGTVDGTCSPLCRDVMVNWWDGGDQQSSNCSCQFKKAYQKVNESVADFEKLNMVVSGLHDRVHYDNLAAACTAPGDTNFACPYPEIGELSPSSSTNPTPVTMPGILYCGKSRDDCADQDMDGVNGTCCSRNASNDYLRCNSLGSDEYFLDNCPQHGGENNYYTSGFDNYADRFGGDVTSCNLRQCSRCSDAGPVLYCGKYACNTDKSKLVTSSELSTSRATGPMSAGKFGNEAFLQQCPCGYSHHAFVAGGSIGNYQVRECHRTPYTDSTLYCGKDMCSSDISVPNCNFTGSDDYWLVHCPPGYTQDGYDFSGLKASCNLRVCKKN